MTCEEIAEQIATLTANFNTVNGTCSEEQAAINLAFVAALAADTYGGSYPTYPPTQPNIQMRITYLSASIHPTPAVVSQYTALNAQLVQLAADQATLAQVVVMLGEMKQQAIDQGC